MREKRMEKGRINQDSRIGFFDSGVGGISVLIEAIRLLPQEDFLFFGDSANAPYGIKTLEEVRGLTIKHVEAMMERGVKAVVVACNTATSAAIKDLRLRHPDFPMIGIEPALKPAALFREHAVIIALATPMTIREEKFHELAERFRNQAEILPVAAGGIVPLVEAGAEDSPEMDAYLEEVFSPYRGRRIDAVVLGCTHFPFAAKAISRYFGPETVLFDGAEGTARELKRRLSESGLLSDRKRAGTLLIENSGGEEKIRLCERLLNLYQHRIR